MEIRPRQETRLTPDLVMAFTQSALAVIVVLGTVVLMFIRSFVGAQFAIPSEWWTLAALVVGYFFGQHRTGNGAKSLGIAIIVAVLVTGASSVIR